MMAVWILIRDQDKETVPRIYQVEDQNMDNFLLNKNIYLYFNRNILFDLNIGHLGASLQVQVDVTFELKVTYRK